MTDLSSNTFDGLLHPRGIAIIGASANLTRPGGRLVQLLREKNYRGGIYPVNPNYTNVAGLPCVSSPLDITSPCDLAMIALRAENAAAAVGQCAAAGIRFAVIYGGGFRETSETGRKHEADLVAAAHAGGIRLIGPNCLGILNIPDRIYCGMGPMLREPFLRAGNVSLVSQSGGFGYSIAMRCSEAGHGLRYVVTSGNEADINTPELINYFLDDLGTKIIISYIEGLNDGRALMAVGRKAAKLGKPILLWKAGRYEQGARAVASHTASMTGRYAIYQAALQQTGIIEVNELGEIIDLVSVFSSDKIAHGLCIGLTGGSGGAAIVFADACDTLGLQIPPLSLSTINELRTHVGGVSQRGNPVDYTGGWLDDPNVDTFKNVVRLLLADDAVDQLCIMFSTAQGKPALNGAKVLAAAAASSVKPIMVFSSAPPASISEVLSIFAKANIPVLNSPQGLARAAYASATFSKDSTRLCASPPWPSEKSPRPSGARRVCNEQESKALLALHGIPVTRDRLLPPNTPIPDDLQYPLVAKVIARGLSHKSDAGGVRLNLRNATELQTAIDEMLVSVKSVAPSVINEGILACEMVDDGLEVIIGVINDEVFGPVVALGLGGTLTEVINDVVYAVAPFDHTVATQMITSLRGHGLFNGVRGQSKRDVDALAQTIQQISTLAWQMRESLLELDINPLFVRAVGKGVMAGDALLVLAKEN